jgi:hypothetical protein
VPRKYSSPEVGAQLPGHDFVVACFRRQLYYLAYEGRLAAPDPFAEA